MLDLAPRVRGDLWERVQKAVEDYARDVAHLDVTPRVSADELRALLAQFDFLNPVESGNAVDFVVRGLSQYQTHTPHPRYYGLFNPAPTTMSIAADTLVAAFNPQLAAWSHSPFASEVERHVVRALAARFGYPPHAIDGTFTSGGAEANHTALLVALQNAFPRFGSDGARGLDAQPVFYLSSEGHRSFPKAARLSGIGARSVREIPVDDELRVDTAALRARIVQDRKEGYAPFMIVATAGTTTAGIVEPIEEMAQIASSERLWLHVDAAWGGAAALLPELRPLLAGVERADSITFDAHKWLSVSMGAGMFFTRHPEILDRTFRTPTPYVPEAQGDTWDPYAHSIQWSRRFIGLKVFLSLLVAGWDGYAHAIRHMTALGDHLRLALTRSRWDVVNETRLPLVCFIDGLLPDGGESSHLERLERSVVRSGRAWISTTRIGRKSALRACITNHRTTPEDVEALVWALNEAREGRS